MKDVLIGVIGGSGLYEMEELEDVEEITVDTPFGSPSAPFVIGTLSGKRIAFLPRHGIGHVLMPSEIPFLANIYGFRKILYDIESYKLYYEINNDPKLEFEIIYNNMQYGYSYYEFFSKMLPFMIKTYEKIIIELKLTELIENHKFKLILHESFNYESFICNKIINYDILYIYIRNKVTKLINTNKLLLELEKYNINKKISTYLINNSLISKYKTKFVGFFSKFNSKKYSSTTKKAYKENFIEWIKIKKKF